MSIQVIPKEKQGQGAFNGGEIIENKPIGFPNDGGEGKPFSSLFYWAYAEARTDSTIGLHPHQGFEIMSFVLQGNIRHFDNKLNAWQPLSAGDVQIIRAGNGISHAEHMEKDSVMFQIWVDPDLNRTLAQEASYDDYKAKDFPVKDLGAYRLRKFTGNGGPLRMDTPGMLIYELEYDTSFEHKLEADKIAAVYVRSGTLEINGEAAKQDDFVLISDTQDLRINSKTPGLLFVIEAPASLSYKTYAQIMAERMGN
jgi:redox-sensitive bicupin YhaK (pirin superfamily)